MSAEVRLHSEGCRERIGARTSRTSASAAKSQSRRSVESDPSVGCSVSWFAARRPKEDPHTHETVRDVTLQETTKSTTGQEKRSGTRWSRRSRSRGVHEARRDCTPRRRPERDAKKAKEEVVKNVTENMHECDQYEQVLRREQQQGRCSAKLQSEKQVT